MKRVLLISLLLLCSGCTVGRYGTFSIASTRPVDFGKHYEKCAVQSVGKDTLHVVILPTGRGPMIANAVENALQQSNGTFLTDGEIKIKLLWALLYLKGWIEVRGTAWCEVAPTVAEREK